MKGYQSVGAKMAYRVQWAIPVKTRNVLFECYCDGPPPLENYPIERERCCKKGVATLSRVDVADS
jgi:hypothetical protein